jgi:Ser/Thr protein kinase RdoA (MazF antagonist)
MKNRLSDLNDHLFAQLERISEENLTPEQIEAEVKRADAIVDLADQVISNVKVQLDGAKLVALHGDRMMKMMPLLTGPASPSTENGAEAK